jgi:DNA polymerase III alpha subunit
MEGLRERYGDPPPAEAVERMEMELGVIDRMGFNAYFLIVWDFCKWARDHGVVVGPGRGSAAGSIVAYTLRITDVDPIRHDLLFERFLNPERVSMPDIDIDFSVRGRERVMQYVVEKYGRESVAQIITFGKMLPRAATKDAAASWATTTASGTGWPSSSRIPSRAARRASTTAWPRDRTCARPTTRTRRPSRSSTSPAASRASSATTPSTPRRSSSPGCR